MNRALVALAITSVLAGVASAESFDIASYAAPRGWSKQDAKGVQAFTTVDKKAGTFCRITLHASMQTLGSSKLDFDADWRDLIATPYKPTAAPKIDARDARGWQVTAGTAPFDWEKHAATAALVMMTNARTRFAVSYLATGDCLAQLRTLIDSLELKPVDAAPAATTAPTATHRRNHHDHRRVDGLDPERLRGSAAGQDRGALASRDADPGGPARRS